MNQVSLFDSAYSLKITLQGTRPSVWRRVIIPMDSTLGYLHEVIQAAMGWDNEHLYDFLTGSGRQGSLRYRMGDDGESAFHETLISALLPKVKSKATYIYDFGDGWQHRVMLEKVTEAAAGQSLPVCTGGKNACPPEDSGGLGGYYGKLEALADSENEYHGDAVEWLGEDFDPTFFALDVANRRLTGVR